MMPPTAEHPPGGRLGVLQEWLRQLGFEGSPFALREAGREEQLDEYFVEPPGFGQARGPHTFLLFAPRGGGKTACRIMVERACRPHDSDSNTLAVPYYRALEKLIAEMEYDWIRVGRERHKQALLYHGVRALCDDLLSRDDAALYAEQRALLRGLIDRYVPDLLTPQNVLPLLRQARAVQGDLDLVQVLDAFEKRQLRQALGSALVSESPAGRVFVSLVDSPSLPVTGSPSSSETDTALSTFADVAQTLGIRSIVVMVDGLDEYPLKSPDVEDQVKMLFPLLSDRRLMEHPILVFKFFLPTALLSALEACDEIRMDRLLSHSVVWEDDALRQLLQQRLIAFSEGRIGSLKALFEHPDSVEDVDARLVRWANGSPRTLLELGDALLNGHCRQRRPSPHLTAADLEAIETRFQVEYAPRLIAPLSIDEKAHQVLIGGVPIAEKTSARELRLLAFLYQHSGEIKNKNDIWKRVYEDDPGGVSDSAIDSLVFRLRQKIERDPHSPVYLTTVRGKGYRLLNTDREE